MYGVCLRANECKQPADGYGPLTDVGSPVPDIFPQIMDPSLRFCDKAKRSDRSSRTKRAASDNVVLARNKWTGVLCSRRLVWARDES